MYHISQKSNTDTVIVSASLENELHEVSSDGKCQLFYKHADMIRPGSIDVDKGGNVYVCGEGSASVHQISHDGKHIGVLLDSSNGLKEPSAIAVKPDGRRFFVADTGDGNKNVIRVYEFR